MSYTHLPKTNEEIIQVDKKKLIFSIKDKPNYIVKIIPDVTYDTKRKSVENEIFIQNKAYDVTDPFSPKIIDYYVKNNNYYIIMEKIEGYTIADYYGENPEEVPNYLWTQIRSIIKRLYLNDIHYIDITPYNFIVDKDKVYIIDFGHASINKVNWFLKEFLDDENIWNPDFR